MATSNKPNVIIFGGVNTYSRTLAAFLVPLEGESLVSHLRIIDKFSVLPATVYLGPEFPKLIQKPNVEYKQANLTIPSIVSKVFDPPEGHEPYSYVFDLTGELRNDRPEEVHIANTLNVARNIGLEAARRKVKAFVRLDQTVYNTPDKGAHAENVDVSPIPIVGTWWHETVRTLAAIKDLNLVVLRSGYVYGPHLDSGACPFVICLVGVYAYAKKTMIGIHPFDNAANTVHVDDVVGALWACAEWMSPLGRAKADELAGELIRFHNDKAKIKNLAGVPAPDANVVAPLFNIVDDSNTNYVSWVTAVAKCFGTTVEFYEMFPRHLDEQQLIEAVEDMNEDHVGIWTKMITASKPPVLNSPLSPYVYKNYIGIIDYQAIGLDNSKIKRMMNYKLKKPVYSTESVQEVIDKWRAEGNYPIF